MELKDGMFVTPPTVQDQEYNTFTYGKKYRVFNVSSIGEGDDNQSFNAIDDDGRTRFCIASECAHIKNQDWIIVNK